MKHLLTAFACLLAMSLSAQTECDNPDLDCDGYVNVTDLLGLLSYFGDAEDGPWLEGDDCFSPDVNCDGFVNVSDLLGLLGAFGEEDLDGDGIWDSEDDCVCAVQGCTDMEACNFDPLATEDDGSCFIADWTQQGADIDGEAADDESGFSVSLSSDGTTVAIGAHYNDGANGTYSGHVRIYALNGSSWTQQGADIDGEAAGDESGWSVSLSADGSTVAIGARGNDGNGSSSGHVRIYAWNGSSWTQQGADIDGEAAGDSSGMSVSLSSGGSTVAIGAGGNDNSSGHVRIYAWNGSSWNPWGQDIDGEAEGDESGWSVSLSADGSTVAIGAAENAGNGTNSGHVRIYAWDGSSWTQQGADIDGEAAGDYSGRSVSLSADGSTVAIGAWLNDGNGSNSGQVRIYAWSGSSWTQQGADIDGEAADDQSGNSVSLSGDGSTVAIGYGGWSNHVRIYTWNGSSWNQQGGGIDGEAANDVSGNSVSLSSDGNTLAIGARWNDGNGEDSGHVRVYSFSCPEIVEGCTDETAANYDPEANVDDGSCIIYGCPFANACNYNPEATDDDGTCIFYCPGCTDETACNYDSEALQDDGSCEYPVDLYGADYVDCTGACLNDEDGDGVCLEDEVYGCADSGACNYAIEATEEDGSCEYESCAGCMDEGACNFDPEAILEDGTCEYESCAGCMYEFACNYDPEATIEDNGTCEFGTCPGCTDPEACNYNPTVTEDDGSCVYSGDSGYDCDGNCLALNSFQQGTDIDGEAAGDYSGRSVSLSSDGSTVAIGAPYNDGNGDASGHVRVYAWNGSSWTQQGGDIDGEAAHDYSGRSVSLSSDGSTVAIAKFNHWEWWEDASYSGHIRVYSWDGSSWVQQGGDIDGQLAAAYSGNYSVSLSSDGATLALGVVGVNGDNGNWAGHVHVYSWDGSSWVQLGSDIDAEVAYDWIGLSVSLSSDGGTVAIGSRNGNDSGHVRIYSWDGSWWVQQGADIDIDGEAADDINGLSVSLSSDGGTVAIGESDIDDNGNDSGHFRIYSWDGSSWVQQGADIDGEAAGDNSGWSVSLSSDGSTVAIGAPYNDGNGSSSGHVRIYTLGCE